MHKLFTWLANAMALIGGLILTALIILTCISILGRGGNTFAHSGLAESFPGLSEWLIDTGIGPIQGDFELVEAGIAFAIFAFLPICQLRGGHASVDIFTSQMPPRFNQFLTVFWEILLAIIIVLISWRLFMGMLDKMNYNETTFLLQFPVWWAYAFSFAASLVAIYCAVVRAQNFIQGRPEQLSLEGGVH
ncbi:MAG: TRAP transporter small permease [Thiolinea sp.]